jgi:hypothetical protein
MIVQLVVEVCRLDDASHFNQNLILGQSLAYQCRKRTQPLCILVRVGRVRSIESGCTNFPLYGCHIFRRHKKKISVWINEAPDEPACRRSVNLNSLACNPLHRAISDAMSPALIFPN